MCFASGPSKLRCSQDSRLKTDPFAQFASSLLGYGILFDQSSSPVETSGTVKSIFTLKKDTTFSRS